MKFFILIFLSGFTIFALSSMTVYELIDNDLDTKTSFVSSGDIDDEVGFSIIDKDDFPINASSRNKIVFPVEIIKNYDVDASYDMGVDVEELK